MSSTAPGFTLVFSFRSLLKCHFIRGSPGHPPNCLTCSYGAICRLSPPMKREFREGRPYSSLLRPQHPAHGSCSVIFVELNLVGKGQNTLQIRFLISCSGSSLYKHRKVCLRKSDSVKSTLLMRGRAGLKLKA